MKLFWLIATLWFCCGIGQAQDREAWKAFQPALSKLLNDSVNRLDDMDDGKDANRARHTLATALAKNGDYLAARKLAARLDATDYAVDTWSTIGRMQGALSRDRAAANAAFAQAVEAARRMEAGSSRQRNAYGAIAEAQARSGDIESALGFVQTLDSRLRNEALLRLARFAARHGNEKPALALLQIANGETEKSQAQSLLALAVAMSEGDTPIAREELDKITRPIYRISVLLALFDNPVGNARGDARLLDEALHAVSLNTPEPFALGFQEVENDVVRGAIALRQLQVGNERESAIKQAAATVATIKSPDNAQKYFERFCEKVAQEDLPTAMVIAERLEGEQRIGVLSAIARGLGPRLANKNLEPKPELRKTIENLVNQALAAANALGENDRRWAGIPIAHALSEAGEFSAAYQVANAIDTANHRAYAFAGIARSAIENRQEAQAQDALKNLQASAMSEKQPEVVAQIVGQTVLVIIEPLIGDESIDIPSALVGLE